MADVPPTDRDLDALAALAAGEMPPEEAVAWRRRIAAEPLLAAAYGRAEMLERRLRAEAAGEPPADLASRVMLGLPRRHADGRGRVAALVRLAAAAAGFAAAWFALGGTAPALAEGAPSEGVSAAIGPWLEASPLQGAPALVGGAGGHGLAAAGAAALGLGLVALGPVLARRWRGAPPVRRST